jgi:prepilin-type N-terminal cleavage/methylation domain-containing protein
MKSNTITNRHNGFSLIEMAVVLFIVALLLGGLLPTVSSQMEQQRRNETKKLMDEIRDSLLGYVMVNGRLPSPACGTIPTIPGTANNAGIELIAASAALCTSSINDIAVLPWATLGVKETDAWGNRFSYRVTPAFTGSVAAGTSAAFTLSSNGDMTIKESVAGNTISSMTPVIFWSHGVNACGAYTSSGTRIDDDTATAAPTYCADADQQENTNNTNTTYISKSTTSTFDDMVVWLSSNAIISRMISANKLP